MLPDGTDNKLLCMNKKHISRRKDKIMFTFVTSIYDYFFSIHWFHSVADCFAGVRQIYLRYITLNNLG